MKCHVLFSIQIPLHLLPHWESASHLHIISHCIYLWCIATLTVTQQVLFSCFSPHFLALIRDCDEYSHIMQTYVIDTTHYMGTHNKLTLFPLTSIKTCCGVLKQGSAGWRKLKDKKNAPIDLVLFWHSPPFHCERSSLPLFNIHSSIFGFLFTLFSSKVTMLLICHATDTTVNLSLEKIRKNVSRLIYETLLTIDTSAKIQCEWWPGDICQSQTTDTVCMWFFQ